MDWLTHIMGMWGYVGIVLLMILENVFPPIPSELIMPFAGYLAAQQKLSFVGVILSGTAGSVLGALPLYALGWGLGEQRLKRWADRYGRWLTLGPEEIERARGWFSRHGRATIFFCRLVPGVRSVISIPAGVDRMNLVSFLFWTALGTGSWSAALAAAGFVLGKYYTLVARFLGPASHVVLGGLLAVLLLWIIRRIIRQRRG